MLFLVNLWWRAYRCCSNIPGSWSVTLHLKNYFLYLLKLCMGSLINVAPLLFLNYCCELFQLTSNDICNATPVAYKLCTLLKSLADLSFHILGCFQGGNIRWLFENSLEVKAKPPADWGKYLLAFGVVFWLRTILLWDKVLFEHIYTYYSFQLSYKHCVP